MFQNLRQGSTLYIIDKTGDAPVFKTGQVVSVGNPAPVYNNQFTMGMQPKFEITVRAKVDGKEGDFAHLPAAMDVHDYGAMFVSDSREAVLNEIGNICQTAQDELDRADKNKAIVAACREMSKAINPSYAKEAERDEAIDSLSSRLDGIESSMAEVLKLLNKK